MGNKPAKATDKIDERVIFVNVNQQKEQINKNYKSINTSENEKKIEEVRKLIKARINVSKEVNGYIKDIYSQRFVLEEIKTRDVLLNSTPSFKQTIFPFFEKMNPPQKREASLPLRISSLTCKSLYDYYSINDYEEKDNSNNNIRKKYINKLILNNSFNKTDNFNNITILDWDDTLLCTTLLTPKGYYDSKIELTQKQKNLILSLETEVFTLLSKCIKDSFSFIITNATSGWVEFSCKKYFPSVYSLLTKIIIISSRDLFNKIYLQGNRQWKIETFKVVIQNFDKLRLSNIICIGDSFAEMEAGHLGSKYFEKSYVKCVKFKESPRIEELIKEISLVNQKYDYIFRSVKNLSISVEKKEKN